MQKLACDLTFVSINKLLRPLLPLLPLLTLLPLRLM